MDTSNNNRKRKSKGAFEKIKESEPRRNKRANDTKSFGPDFISFMMENEPFTFNM